MLVVLLLPAIASAAVLSARLTVGLLKAHVEREQKAGSLPLDDPYDELPDDSSWDTCDDDYDDDYEEEEDYEDDEPEDEE